MAIISKEDAKRALSDVDSNHVFWVCNGQVLKNIKQLPAAMKKMKKEVFEHHVNKEKNDFASWINDIVKDTKLAADLKKVKDKKGIIKKAADRIKFLEKKAK
ncbi:MAG: hypothetical protein PHV16_04615 [Candidatus Nanoarchaeia archaeon]|nr:hypothetical protein [Candidatus Nanoarchaeia archaeon]